MLDMAIRTDGFGIFGSAVNVPVPVKEMEGSVGGPKTRQARSCEFVWALVLVVALYGRVTGGMDAKGEGHGRRVALGVG